MSFLRRIKYSIDNILEKIILDKKNHFFYFIILLIILLIISYFCFGIRTGHDYAFHLHRLNVLVNSIKVGDYPLYIDYETIEGYGYFTSGFYPDFTLIPFALIGIITGPYIAYQIMIYIMAFLCGVFTYKASERIFRHTFIAGISAILFTFSYYKLLDTYIRASLGETICFTFIPLVMWGLYEIIKGRKEKWYLLTIAMSMILLSHVLSALIIGVSIFIILLISFRSFIKERTRIYYLLLSAFFTLLLTSYFIAPLLELMNSNEFYYNKHLVNQAYGHEFYRIFWELFSGIFPSMESKFVTGCGIVITWTLSLRLFIFDKSALRKKGDYMFIIGLICMFIMSPLYPWNIFPFSKLNVMQFSWRFYTVISYFFALAGGVYLYIILKTDIRRLKLGVPFILIFTIIIMIFTGRDYSNKNDLVVFQELKPQPDNYYFISGAEYLPAKIPYPFIDFFANRKENIRYNSQDMVIDNVKMSTHKVFSFDVATTTRNVLELPLTYYKGYQANIDGEKIEISQSDNGLIEVLASQSGNIKVWYEGTLIQKISFYISIASLLLLCVYIFIVNSRRKRRK